MKKNKLLILSSLFLLMPISACSNEDYDKLLAHNHTYDPASLSWSWREKAEGGYDVNVSITCSTCDENKSGHTITVPAVVKGPNVIKEAGCGVEGEVSYTASATINEVTYYQSKFVTTEATAHELDDEILYSDDTYHWYQCKHCLKVMGKEAHQYSAYELRDNSFYYDRECSVCDHLDSYFSTDLFNTYLEKFNALTITPFDKEELDDAKEIYDSLNSADQALITNYQKVVDCYTAMGEFFAQWDVAGGSFGSVFGNTIPANNYTSASNGEQELSFEIANNTAKGACLAMKVNQNYSVSGDFGFYADAFAKNANYVTGSMYVYCPEATQTMYVNASTLALELTVNLTKGWNRIDFNETQWGKLNDQTYAQIRFTFANQLKVCEEKWLFSSAYGRMLNINDLNATIASLPNSINDFAPYRLKELTSIQNKYNSLSETRKNKVVNYEKVTQLLTAYNSTYQKAISTTGAWYNIMGNTSPTAGLYVSGSNPNGNLLFATDSTERGDVLTVACNKEFTNDAGFYFDTNNFSIKYSGTLYKKMYIYIYAPQAKTIELRSRVSGETWDTELIKSVDCVKGWNDIELSTSELQAMGNKTPESVQNFLAFYFKGGLTTTSGTFKFAVPYGAKN